MLPDGRAAFNLIQNASDIGQGSLVFFLFDLLFVDGEDITGLPLVDRKARLKTLLNSAPQPSAGVAGFIEPERFTSSLGARSRHRVRCI